MNDEFSLKVNDNTLRAMNGTIAGKGMDLLTVLLHEQAHILGFEHKDNEDTSLMFATLTSGIRYLLDGSIVDMLAGTKVTEAVIFSSRSSIATPRIDLSLDHRASSQPVTVATWPLAISERNGDPLHLLDIPVRKDDLYQYALGSPINDEQRTRGFEPSKSVATPDSVDGFFEQLASEDFTKGVQEYDLMAKLADRYFDGDH